VHGSSSQKAIRIGKVSAKKHRRYSEFSFGSFKIMKIEKSSQRASQWLSEAAGASWGESRLG
jgi:hypothetical protein